MYNPTPKDTSKVLLSQDILDLTEMIAADVHDTWAAARITEGWVYGERKDSVTKQTPLLVSYDELPESEKAYDRQTALQTIKLILLSGFEIRKKPSN